MIDTKTIRSILLTYKLCKVCDNVYLLEDKPNGRICPSCTTVRAREVIRKVRARKRFVKEYEKTMSINS